MKNPRLNQCELLQSDWCEGRDSNPHALRRWNLNPVRLPIPPLSRTLVPDSYPYTDDPPASCHASRPARTASTYPCIADVRRPLREFPGCLHPAARAGCASRSTAIYALCPQRRRLRRRRRPADRRTPRRLDRYGAELDAHRSRAPTPATRFSCACGRPSPSIDLPLALFRDLLDAFSQDVVKTRYADFAELMDYCRRSANPVGRLLLHLFGADDAGQPAPAPTPSAPPAAHQLLAGRRHRLAARAAIYLPQDETGALRRHRSADRRRPLRTPTGAALMHFQIDRARAMMLQPARRWAATCPAASAWKCALIVAGGLRILDKIEARRRRRLPPPSGARQRRDWPRISACMPPWR